MSEDDQQDKASKTEDPTPKKLSDAIKKGNVVNSREVTSFFMLLFLTIAAIWVMPFFIKLEAIKLRFFVENAGNIPLDIGMTDDILCTLMKKTLLYASPVFFIVYLAAIISSYAQHGQFIWSMESIKPQLSRISFYKGFKKICSVKSVVEFLKSLFKILLVATCLYFLITIDIKELSLYQELSISGIIDQVKIMIYDIITLVTIIMAAIAFIDFAYQKHEYYTNLKMTKQEVKDELKQTEGNPEIKRKLKELRRQQSQKYIKQIVPEATVIITNPEHYAVALKYKMNEIDVPICIAKGLDFLAQTIKEIASDHKIPIVENPVLARTLYKEVDIGQEIPVEQFEAVAKVISYVMSLEQKKKQQQYRN